jgi:hypothetical protein
MIEPLEPFWSDLELPYRGMERKAAERAYAALIDSLPRKVECLTSVLRRCGITLTGEPRQDLRAVGVWLGEHAREMRLSRDPAERERMLAGVPQAIVQETGCTCFDPPTCSMCYYVGYFFSELIRKACPEACYVRVKDKGFADHNQPVLMRPPGRGQFNPVRIVLVFCGKCIHNNGRPPETGDLVDLYDLHVEGYRSLGAGQAPPT